MVQKLRFLIPLTDIEKDGNIKALLLIPSSQIALERKFVQTQPTNEVHNPKASDGTCIYSMLRLL